MKTFTGIILALGVAAFARAAEPYASKPEFFSQYSEKIKGQTVPEGAVGYQEKKHTTKLHWIFRGGSSLPVMWFNEAPAYDIPFNYEAVPAKAIGYRISLVPVENGYAYKVNWIQGDFFRDELPSFLGRGESSEAVAHHAYLKLVDETIGLQSVDAVEKQVGDVSSALSAEIDRSKLASLKALFDSAGDTAPEAVAKPGSWGGKCAFRVEPNLAVGAALEISESGKQKKASLVYSVDGGSGELTDQTARPTKYLDASQSDLEALAVTFSQLRPNFTALSAEPPEGRPLKGKSLHFDNLRDLGGSAKFERGYRLKSYVSASGKSVYVVEGYAMGEGLQHAKFFTRFLEPLVYCVFHQPLEK